MPTRRLPSAVLTVPVALLVLMLAAAAHAADHPCWPLELSSRYLTGNFMEPRGGRFHAGIDFKTESRAGYPVLATADGWVSRIRFSPGGYGQALHLTAADGTTYVYAHLERLRDDLRARAHARQQETGAYEVDLWLARDEVRVRCGDVLALSGQSGAGGPHLHLEVRGPDGIPLDPLAHGFDVADTLPPEILAVRAHGSGPDGPVCWLWGDGKARLAGSLPELRLPAGPVHFSALIVERSDRQRHLLYPWRVRLLVDGREVFVVANERLPWDLNDHQRLEFVSTPLGQETWLWLDDRNRLAGRAGEPWLAAGDWSDGLYVLQLIAEDRAGNRAEVSWRLVIGDVGAAASGWPAAREVRRDRWRIADGGDPEPDAALVPLGLEMRRGRLIEPVPDRFWRLSGLVPVGEAVQYRTADGLALLDAVTVTLPGTVAPADVDLADPTLAVYRLQRHAWVRAGRLADTPDGPGFVLAQPGTYRLLQDRAAPVIATASVTRTLEQAPPRERRGITLPRWPLVKVPVADHGSGVDWGTLVVELDGARLIAEPDPPRDRIIVELPDTLAAGTYRLRVAVADHAGHRARNSVDLVLTEPVAAPGGPEGAVEPARAGSGR